MNRFKSNLIDFCCYSCGNNAFGTGLTQDNAKEDSYKLIYIYEGVCGVDIDGTCYTAEKGDSVLVFPFCSFTLNAEGCRYAWLEFAGFTAAAMLGRIAFSQKNPVLGKIEMDGFEDLFDIPTETDKPYSLYRLGACILLLLSYYIEQFPSKTVETEGYVFRACRYIEAHFSERSFGVSELAEALKIDRSHLYRLFKDEMGVSVIKYITQYRVSKAELLLAKSELSIKDVAYSVGFSDQMYFSRVFKQLNGRTPSAFREMIFSKDNTFPKR